MIRIITIIVAIAASLLGGIGALYLKKASGRLELKLKTLLNSDLMLGLLFYFLSAAAVIFLIKFDELSIVYPLTALTYVFVAVLSWKFLDEKINIYKSGAIGLIVIGVALVALS